MRFWSVLGKDGASSEEIGKELVGIEAQLPEFKRSASEAEEAAVRVRQRKLGGGKVSEKDLADVERAREGGHLDVVALERSLDELRQRLIGAVAKEQQDECERIAVELRTVAQEEAEVRAELVEVAVRFNALLARVAPRVRGGIHGQQMVGTGAFGQGHQAVVGGNFDYPLFILALGRPLETIPGDLMEKLLAEFKRQGLLDGPTPAACIRLRRGQLEAKRNLLGQTGPETTAAALLLRLRGEREGDEG